ncbi:MAG: methionine synthase [Candidatus Melainabacteria bacterium]|nr:methionine synthase [Candidatus Melainabacteria bacterium]
MSQSGLIRSVSEFFKPFQERALLFDGAMGTCIQNYPLTPDDFHGLDGCNEYLVKTRPDVIQAIHAAYFEAGSDIVETNSFGSTGVVLAEYDIAEQTYDLNRRAAVLAKEVANAYSKHKPRFVAGSVGPTTKLPTLGHIAYADLRAAYEVQMQGLVDGGVDVLLIETTQDLLQAKAALAAAQRVKQKAGLNLPVMVQVTIEATGTMLVGSDIATVVTALSPFDVDVIGMNCATGPREMSEHIRHLAQHSPCLVSCQPNAGIPENVGGHAHYHLTPPELAQHLTHFVGDLGVTIIGGCCGTTPEHIRALTAVTERVTPGRRSVHDTPMLSSLYASVPLRVDPAPVLVGERTNANGSKKFRDLLAADDYDGLVEIARSQVRQGAHLLDVCTAYVGRDEVKDMVETVRRLNQQVDVPLMIDSTEVPVIEAALQQIAGRAIVNSINLEDGEDKLNQVVALCKQYGAAVVALTIDEQGMAKTVERKLSVARRIYDLVVHQHGMNPADLVFDTLTFTLGSGDEEFRTAGIETIEAIRAIKQAFPQVGTVLGVSNISFGLKQALRPVLNSVFLHEAVLAGLDMAIINSAHILPLNRIDEAEKALCRALIYNEWQPVSSAEAAPSQPIESDPLMRLIAYYETHEGAKVAGGQNTLPEVLEERLKYRLINGEKSGLEADLALALAVHSPLAIINEILLDGMKTVGELFGRGDMQLPFVLQSAEVMKTAVAYLEPHMDKVGEATGPKGTMVIATVKGDVHDIGKNLVDIIVSNNGYKVVNLGIKVPIDDILKATDAHQADAIAMSGLLVKSTAIMRENLILMEERGYQTPVMLGGAALTRRFVEEDCQRVYSGQVTYVQDAFASLHLMDSVVKAKAEGRVLRNPNGPVQPAGALGVTAPSNLELASAKNVNASEQLQQPAQPVSAVSVMEASSPVLTQTVRSAHVPCLAELPKPPFWGTRLLDVPVTELYPYLNTPVLYTGHWQFRRGNKTRSEHDAFLAETVAPILEDVKQRAEALQLLKPQVIYGYFPCYAQGNDLILLEEDLVTERLRFTFPRGGAKQLCLADYFAPKDSGLVDVLPLHIVTVGPAMSEYERDLFAQDRYTEYLYMHGYGVEMAEALAEWMHKQVRLELDIAGEDEPDILKMMQGSGEYRGCRYSFGYPACPNLEDQVPLFSLLQPERIGITLTESFLLEPEQSTSAIIVHHPDAYYFDVR